MISNAASTILETDALYKMSEDSERNVSARLKDILRVIPSSIIVAEGSFSNLLLTEEAESLCMFHPGVHSTL